MHRWKKQPAFIEQVCNSRTAFMRPGLLYLFGLWRASSDAIARGRSLLPVSPSDTIVRRRSKKKSNKFLKSVILLSIFAVIWLLFQYPLFPPGLKTPSGNISRSKKRSRPSPNRRLNHFRVSASRRSSSLLVSLNRKLPRRRPSVQSNRSLT